MINLDNITNTLLLLQKTIHANQLIHMRRDASHNIILESLVSEKSLPNSSCFRIERVTEQGIIARDEAPARCTTYHFNNRAMVQTQNS
jgi:hypothetical protein